MERSSWVLRKSVRPAGSVKQAGQVRRDRRPQIGDLHASTLGTLLFKLRRNF